MKETVYDYWIASDNDYAPKFYWLRSLDAALLGIMAALSALMDLSNNMDLQLALVLSSCFVLTLYSGLLLRLRPYQTSRGWALYLRVAALGIASLASILRFCGSEAVSLPQYRIDALAGVIVLFLLVALGLALIVYQRVMLISMENAVQGVQLQRASSSRFLRKLIHLLLGSKGLQRKRGKEDYSYSGREKIHRQHPGVISIS